MQINIGIYTYTIYTTIVYLNGMLSIRQHQWLHSSIAYLLRKRSNLPFHSPQGDGHLNLKLQHRKIQDWKTNKRVLCMAMLTLTAMSEKWGKLLHIYLYTCKLYIPTSIDTKKCMLEKEYM